MNFCTSALLRRRRPDAIWCRAHRCPTGRLRSPLPRWRRPRRLRSCPPHSQSMWPNVRGRHLHLPTRRPLVSRPLARRTRGRERARQHLSRLAPSVSAAPSWARPGRMRRLCPCLLRSLDGWLRANRVRLVRESQATLSLSPIVRPKLSHPSSRTHSGRPIKRARALVSRPSRPSRRRCGSTSHLRRSGTSHRLPSSLAIEMKTRLASGGGSRSRACTRHPCPRRGRTKCPLRGPRSRPSSKTRGRVPQLRAPLLVMRCRRASPVHRPRRPPPACS